MSILHDAYVALLADLTTKTGNEIHWENKYGTPITIEPLENEKYIVRRYYENGNKWWEEEWQNDQRHGKSIIWNQNGNRSWEREYQNNKQHEKEISWYENGNKWWELKYQNGIRHGKYISWYKNGNIKMKAEYQNGKML